VCETCNPAVDPLNWSLEPGFFHDRDTASQRNSGPNDYGMYFASRSNGCQMLPSMMVHSSPSHLLRPCLPILACAAYPNRHLPPLSQLNLRRLS
jgi:hypothetical protein